MTVWKPIMERGKSTGQYNQSVMIPANRCGVIFASIVEQNDTKHLPGVVT